MSKNPPADPIEEPELDEGEESDEYDVEVRVQAAPVPGEQLSHMPRTG